MQIKFENFWKDNQLFIDKILMNINVLMNLRSEYEHKKYIELFEKEFASYNKSKYAIAVNSGTTALQIALEASGVKNDDEVIIPSYTYISTALAISNIGAKPIFVDIKEDTLTMNPEEIKKYITKKTKAIIPVHIHGNPCDMEKIEKITKKYNLKLIEDASHAHGAEYKLKKVGNFGIGCFSTHTSKNFSGIGNSGLITTNNIETYQLIRKMIEVKNDPHSRLCKRTPCQIDSLQVAILKSKLFYLDKINEQRRVNAALYFKSLPKIIKCQKEEKNSKHVYRDFVIVTKKREELMHHLEHNGIEVKIRYKTPLHLTEYYKKKIIKKSYLPVTEGIFQKLIWLPISCTLQKKEINYICEKISSFSGV